jgi:hypothetical protein
MLTALLARCRGTDDLRLLFGHLGYHPDEGDADDPWVPLARWRTFRVIGAVVSDPRDAARGMARRLAATAQPGLVAALGAGALALAVPRLGVGRSSPVLAVPLDRPEPLHLQLLAELMPRPGATALEHGLRVGEVLSTEAVGSRFFVAFRRLVERAGAAVESRDAADRRLLALLPLTRVLFLYFVQAKGWLDGRPDFLRAQLDDTLAQRRHFHRAVLHPLFFGTLNRPTAARSHRDRFGRIPYLNGGLFEPHPLERTAGPVVLPNAFWREAFDDVFERFRFCLREGDEVGAIAPDMLGRVFEGVMDAGERRASGTFYTPATLVRDVVIATLATALADAHLPLEPTAEVLRGGPCPPARWARLRERLRAIRVLDPAVGSGAFLLGALEVLTTAWSATGDGQDVPPGRLRRRLLDGHLFGVDVNPIAVRLAELRLWLAIVADDPEHDISRVRPLPNLNGVVRQGDTLLDPIAAVRALGLTHMPPAEAAAVASARHAVFSARGPDRALALAALRQAELRATRAMIAAAVARGGRALRELESVARSPDLFGRRAGLSREQRLQCDLLRARLRDLRVADRAAARGSVPFFAFEVHHPDAMAAGGFTVVVGNPPWVRAERLPRAMRSTLALRFRWWRSTGGRGFGHQPDLAVAFLERALELAAPGGAIGLLLPGKLASAAYAETARRSLVRDTTLTYIHRVPDREAAGFGAVVYPLALVARKHQADDSHRVSLTFTAGATVAQRALQASGPWVLLGDAERAALDAFKSSGPSLHGVAPPMLGVKTGADDVLVGTIVERGAVRWTLRFGAADVELERGVLRPVLRGRDLAPWRASPECAVIWPYGRAGALRSELPSAAARWIAVHRARLARRADYRTGPVWALFRVRAGIMPNRVVWADVARTATAAVLAYAAPDAVPINTCYVSAAPDDESALAIAATINSAWGRVLVHAVADEARGGYRRFNARAVGRVPVPVAGAARRRLAALARSAHTTHDVDTHEIDEAVADALGLSREVRATLRALADDRR